MGSHSAVSTEDSEKQALWQFGGSLLLVEVVYNANSRPNRGLLVAIL